MTLTDDTIRLVQRRKEQMKAERAALLHQPDPHADILRQQMDNNQRLHDKVMAEHVPAKQPPLPPRPERPAWDKRVWFTIGDEQVGLPLSFLMERILQVAGEETARLALDSALAVDEIRHTPRYPNQQ